MFLKNKKALNSSRFFNSYYSPTYGEYKFKEKIKEFKTQLNNNNIIQVHRSYLINLDFVYDANTKYIILRNKKEINIGKTYKKKFKLTYQDYLLNGSL